MHDIFYFSILLGNLLIGSEKGQL